jgi:hypothetical protein
VYKERQGSLRGYNLSNPQSIQYNRAQDVGFYIMLTT